jgi:hypothetical protein
MFNSFLMHPYLTFLLLVALIFMIWMMAFVCFCEANNQQVKIMEGIRKWWLCCLIAILVCVYQCHASILNGVAGFMKRLLSLLPLLLGVKI